MIPQKLTYFAVNVGCILIPLLASFHPRLAFHKQWKYFWLPCLLTAVGFVVWDIWFTAIGVWRFDPAYVCGIYCFNLPIEEVLFFIFIPYACTFTYYCCSLIRLPLISYKAANNTTLLLIVALFLIAVVHRHQLYTSITFLLLSITLAFFLYTKASFLPVFFVSYLLILIPFFIANGILTGSWIAHPVVVYNDQQNLGIRLMTIPVEDLFYGMLLQLLNVAGFQWLKSKG